MLDTSKIPTKRVDGYYTHITNCITKIPQNIKLELVDGTLTLKAGSKVYVPNGFEEDTTTQKFDIINIQEDISMSAIGDIENSAVYLNIESNSLVYRSFDSLSSGTTDPQTPSTCYYNTETNKILDTSSAGIQSQVSLPIAQVVASGGKFTKIKQIFNGFGYIGSTIFALPGVECYIPNGYNEDGSIKNIHCQIEEVQTKQTLNGWNNHWYVHLMGENLIEYHPWELYYNQVDKPMSVGQTAYWYNPNEKIVQSTDDFGTTWNTTRQVTPFLEVFQNGETITSIKPINVYENTTSKTVENKFKVVSELPSFPEVGVFYFVKE